VRDAVPRWWLDGFDEVDHAAVGCLEAASGLVGLVASPRQWLWRFVCLALLAGDAGLGFLDGVACLVMGWVRIGGVRLSGLGLAVS
jgi:hypothetical protein